MAMDFELIPHTADIKLRVYGKTLEDLFRNALIGMFQSIGPQIKGCILKNERVLCKELPFSHEINLDSIDQEALLVDFLSEALYLSDVYNEAYLDAKIHELSNSHIRATIYGAKVTGYEVVEIKAVTHHDLAIKQENGLWQTDIVFDI